MLRIQLTILEENNKDTRVPVITRSVLQLLSYIPFTIRAATSQNVPSDICAQRSFRSQSFFMRTTKTLIRLRGCAGWSESSLGAHVRRYIFLRCSSFCLRIRWLQLNDRIFHGAPGERRGCLFTFITLWRNSADDKLIFCSFFLQKTGFGISCK